MPDLRPFEGPAGALVASIGEWRANRVSQLFSVLEQTESTPKRQVIGDF